MGVYRANYYCVLFTVRLDEKRTAKALPCVFGLCRAPVAYGKPPVSGSGVQVAHRGGLRRKKKQWARPEEEVTSRTANNMP
jgi:hypothetical protein